MRNTTRLLDVAIPVAAIVWAIIPFSRYTIALLPSITAFFVLLTLRSHELYLRRIRLRQFSGSFKDYLKVKRIMLQNTLLAFFLGSTGIILEAIAYAVHSIGGLTLLGGVDVFLLAIILIAFFRRPGIQKTLSRSFPADPESSRFMESLSAQCSMKSPEFRIIPSGRGNRANAFSWSLPGGRSYIFANEDLFVVLNMEEAGGILTHELGHIRGRHSEKSFLLASLIPLLWLNFLTAPFALFPLLYASLLFAAALAIAIAYLYLGRGSLSRRFEKQADRFAAHNYDREVYLSALRKLSESRGPGASGSNGKFTSHDSLEERERLIRGL